MNTDTRPIMTFLRKAVSITVAVLFIFNQATVFALPQDYTIISGDATVTTDAATKTTTINATSANTIIN
jgi:hypothetical protein